MTAFQAEIGSVCDAIAIEDDGFSWFGRPYGRDADVRGPARDRPQWLENAVADHLYRHFFMTGGARTRGICVPPAVTGWTPLAEELARANRHRRSRQPGWVRTAAPGPLVEVMRSGVRVWVTHADLAGEPCTGAPGEVTLLVPADSVDAFPGYYVALGARDVDPACTALTRLYWNVNPEGAPDLVRATSHHFSEAGIPYRLKLPNLPAAYERVDCGVLYVERPHEQRAFALAAAVAREVASGLEAATPPLTVPLVPGVAVAHDPGSGGSFGRHRCGLIARGLIAARRDGLRSRIDRIAQVTRAFAVEGADAAGPALGTNRVEHR